MHRLDTKNNLSMIDYKFRYKKTTTKAVVLYSEK